jgi:hypothetical protein
MANVKYTDITSGLLNDPSLEVVTEEFLLDPANLSKQIVDLSLPVKTRIEALNLYYTNESENAIETINKLIMMYELSGTKVLRSFLFDICDNSTIPPFLQSLCAKGLCGHNMNDELGYKAVSIVYPKLGKDVGTPYKIEFVKLLMKNINYKAEADKYFCEIIDDTSLNCDYRYKAILGLGEEYSEFTVSACKIFINNSTNTTNYRILGCQNLLIRKVDVSQVEKVLLGFSTDEKVEYNLRADATDVLLQMGTESSKALAQKIIMELGRTGSGGGSGGSGAPRTLYDNAQNVHTKEVEDGVKDALEFLQSFSVMTIDLVPITIEYVEKAITVLAVDRPGRDKIQVSMNRIVMDRALYSKYNCTLALILLHVWTYISGHKYETEMKKRLLEEMEEMAGTCSSGFAGRLINTISGFGDFTMRISWRDQITGNLTARINKKIQDMDDLRLQEKVMNEMTLETPCYEDRKNFLKFLRRHVFSLREELYYEFKEYITDTDFDLYFRGAMSMYETGEFV